MTLDNVPVPQPSIWSAPQRFLKKELLPVLTDLRLAILLLLAIALFSISGTVIEQGQPVAFYQSNYPEDPALFGFLSWKVLLAAGFDHGAVNVQQNTVSTTPMRQSGVGGKTCGQVVVHNNGHFEFFGVLSPF